jgi:hypothetical protein
LNLEICRVTFEDLKLGARFGEKIRGYLGEKYKEINLLHNHDGDNFIYRYPMVQYKVIGNNPMIIGVNEASNLVANIGINDDEFILDKTKYETFQKEIKKDIQNFGTEIDYIEYKFLTPWIAINQKNNYEYKNATKMEQENILKKILIGNIISMSKGLNYTVDKKLDCWINLKEIEVALKGVKHRGFLGEFKVNFVIPNYFGIGKSVSRGFGTVLRK